MYSTPRRHCFFFFFFNDTATTEIYTLSLHDALPISIIFGVVPDATSEWNPEIAPHAMVMNANGNSLPANTGPSPSVANGVSAGIRSGGGIIQRATAGTQSRVRFTQGERETAAPASNHNRDTHASH